METLFGLLCMFLIIRLHLIGDRVEKRWRQYRDEDSPLCSIDREKLERKWAERWW
jgi:hypothetical protein